MLSVSWLWGFGLEISRGRVVSPVCVTKEINEQVLVDGVRAPTTDGLGNGGNMDIFNLARYAYSQIIKIYPVEIRIYIV